jgi:hypothetical protein
MPQYRRKRQSEVTGKPNSYDPTAHGGHVYFPVEPLPLSHSPRPPFDPIDPVENGRQRNTTSQVCFNNYDFKAAASPQQLQIAEGYTGMTRKSRPLDVVAKSGVPSSYPSPPVLPLPVGYQPQVRVDAQDTALPVPQTHSRLPPVLSAPVAVAPIPSEWSHADLVAMVNRNFSEAQKSYLK